MVDAVPNFRQSPLFTPAEKAAMALADAMAGDHTRAPFDEIFAELRKHYGEEQIVELGWRTSRSEEHTSELQSPYDLVCRLLLEKKKKHTAFAARAGTCEFACVVHDTHLSALYLY